MSKNTKFIEGTPEPRKQAGAGSLTNMPSQEEIARWTAEEKPKLIQGIRQSWRQIQNRCNKLNGAVRMTDTKGNT